MRILEPAMLAPPPIEPRQSNPQTTCSRIPIERPPGPFFLHILLAAWLLLPSVLGDAQPERDLCSALFLCRVGAEPRRHAVGPRSAGRACVFGHCGKFSACCPGGGGGEGRPPLARLHETPWPARPRAPWSEKASRTGGPPHTRGFFYRAHGTFLPGKPGPPCFARTLTGPVRAPNPVHRVLVWRRPARREVLLTAPITR